MRGKPFTETAIELLQNRPGVAAELLKIAIEENTPEELAIVIRQIRAAGYDVSVMAKPKPAPRKRAKPAEAKTAARQPVIRSKKQRVAAIALR